MLIPTLLRLYYSIEINNLKKFEIYIELNFRWEKKEELQEEKFNEYRSEAKIIGKSML